MRRNSPVLDNGPLQQWRQLLREQIEAHPIRVTTIAVTGLSIIGAGLLQQIANPFLFNHLVPWLGASQPMPRWVMFALAVMTLGTLVLLWQRSLEHARLRALTQDLMPAATYLRMKTAEGQRDLLGGYLNVSVEVLEALMVSLGESPLGASLAPAVFEKLATLILKRLQRMYAQHISHGSIYVVSSDSPDFLALYAHLNLPERSQGVRWYIGPISARRRAEGGCAGKCHVSRKPLIHHIDPRTNRAEEGTDYLPLGDRTELALHLSMCAMPILDSSARCIGVLCLDSSARETFDGDKQLAALEPAARVLSQVLKLRQRTTAVDAAAQ